MTAPPDSRSRAARRVVFLPRWHDNPYQELLAEGLSALGIDVEHEPVRLLFLTTVLRGGTPDVVHLHTPDPYIVYRQSTPAAVVALGLFVVQLALLRLLGVRVIWTAHDLQNHERRYPRLDRLSRLALARLSHAVIVHCAEAGRQAAAAFGIDASRLRIVPHGHYQDRYPRMSNDKAGARAALDLPAEPFTVLLLGNLRPHKGLGALLDAYGRMDRPGTLLVIAGEPSDETLHAELLARAAGRPDILLRPGFVPDQDVPGYLCAADIVVCPFTSSLTSGSLALALSFGKAVVAARLGCAGDMVTDDGGFLYDPAAPDGLVSALRAAFDARSRLDDIGARNRVRAARHDWGTIARQTLAVYEDRAIG